MIAEPLVELESVSKDYGVGGASVHALGDVTLTLGQGALCRRPRSLRLGQDDLAEHDRRPRPPQLGRVEVDGLEVSALPEDALVEYRRETVGFVFQAFGLIPILSAAENVEIPLRLRRSSPPSEPRASATSCASSTSPTAPTTDRKSCPEASSSEWRSPARSGTSRAC